MVFFRHAQVCGRPCRPHKASLGKLSRSDRPVSYTGCGLNLVGEPALKPATGLEPARRPVPARPRPRPREPAATARTAAPEATATGAGQPAPIPTEAAV